MPYIFNGDEIAVSAKHYVTLRIPTSTAPRRVQGLSLMHSRRDTVTVDTIASYNQSIRISVMVWLLVTDTDLWNLWGYVLAMVLVRDCQQKTVELWIGLTKCIL